jgi:alpha/beta superfamily hydrolase
MNEYETRESVVLINDNQKIFSVFHKPQVSDDSVKFPAILICHGFAGQKCGKFRFYVTLAEELAKIGIASLRIDFRGCGDSEGEFSNTTLSSQVSDACLALDYLKNHNQVDSSKIGICGRSFGGAVSVIAARKFHSIKSIVLLAPMFSADSWAEKWHMLKKTIPSDNKNVVVMDGQIAGIALLTEIFAMRLDKELLSLNYIPLLHIQGDSDKVISDEHTLKFRDCRKRAILTEFIALKGCDHEFSDLTARKEAIEKTVLWFKKTLTYSDI